MRSFSFLILLSSFSFLLAQEIEPINTDRPDQSDGTYIVPKFKFQIEDGFYIDRESFLDNLMIRMGITKSTEVRVLVDGGRVGRGGGVLPIGFSFKQRVNNQRKLIPAFTIAFYYRNEQLASSSFQSKSSNYFLNLAFQNELNDAWCLGYNLGTTDFGNNVIFTTSLVFAPFDKLSFFCEIFERFETGSNPQHNTDIGIMYLVNKRLQLDVALATSVLRQDVNQYLTFGFSYRFK